MEGSSSLDNPRKFFSFKPRSFLADVQNAVDDYIADASDAIEKALVEECGTTAAIKSEIQKGCDVLNTQLSEKFGKEFNTLAKYSERNLFAIDDDVMLPGESDSSSSSSSSSSSGAEATSSSNGTIDTAAIDKELAELEERFAAAKAREKQLASRQKRLVQLEQVLETNQTDIADIKQNLGAQSSEKLKLAELNAAAQKLRRIQNETKDLQNKLDAREKEEAERRSSTGMGRRRSGANSDSDSGSGSSSRTSSRKSNRYQQDVDGESV